VLHQSFDQQNTHAVQYFPAANGTHRLSGHRHPYLLGTPTRRRCIPFVRTPLTLKLLVALGLHLVLRPLTKRQRPQLLFALRSYKVHVLGAWLVIATQGIDSPFASTLAALPFEMAETASADVAFPSAVSTDLTLVSTLFLSRSPVASVTRLVQIRV